MSSTPLAPKLLQEIDTILATRLARLADEQTDAAAQTARELNELRSILGTVLQTLGHRLKNERQRQERERKRETESGKLTLDFDFEVRCLSRMENPSDQLIPTNLRDDVRHDPSSL
ncbi:MAG: hypothetical protein MK538_18710 [Planctomycetes bacterium]|nr:hypothetical protein [Planctomycetota bacterium]